MSTPSKRDLSWATVGSVDEAAFDTTDELPIVRRNDSDATKCLDADALRAVHAAAAANVMDTLQIKEETAKLLLRRTRPPWDVDKVCEAWYDEGGLDRLLSSKRQRRGQDLACVVCCSSGENEVFFTLSCEHVVCTECLAGLLQSVLHPSDGVAAVKPPFTCAQLGGVACDGGACAGVLEAEISSLPLGEADAALLRAADPATSLDDDVGASPFRRCPNCPDKYAPSLPSPPPSSPPPPSSSPHRLPLHQVHPLGAGPCLAPVRLRRARLLPLLRPGAPLPAAVPARDAVARALHRADGRHGSSHG